MLPLGYQSELRVSDPQGWDLKGGDENRKTEVNESVLASVWLRIRLLKVRSAKPNNMRYFTWQLVQYVTCGVPKIPLHGFAESGPYHSILAWVEWRLGMGNRLEDCEKGMEPSTAFCRPNDFFWCRTRSQPHPQNSNWNAAGVDEICNWLIFFSWDASFIFIQLHTKQCCKYTRVPMAAVNCKIWVRSMRKPEITTKHLFPGLQRGQAMTPAIQDTKPKVVVHLPWYLGQGVRGGSRWTTAKRPSSAHRTCVRLLRHGYPTAFSPCLFTHFRTPDFIYSSRTIQEAKTMLLLI